MVDRELAMQKVLSASLAPVIDGLKHVQRGVDRTASELAIARLQRDADGLTQQWQTVKAKSYLGLSGWGAFLLVLGLLTLRGQPFLAWTAVIVGVVLLVAAFNGSTKKAKELADLELQYAATVGEINKHKSVVGL